MSHVVTICVILCLLPASVANAAPVTPDTVGWTVLDLRVCCVEGVTLVFPDRPLSVVTNLVTGFGGSAWMPPSVTTDSPIEIAIDLRVVRNQLAEVGTLRGVLQRLMLDDGAYVAEACCLGNIAGIAFMDATAPQIWRLDATHAIPLTGEAHLLPAPMIPAPEPSTFVLLGIGVLSRWMLTRRG